MNKVLILGSGGMLGHVVFNYLKDNSNFDLINISRSRRLNNETILINVRDEKKLEAFIKTNKPDFVINCIGVLISNSNKDPESAIYINSYLPLMLSRVTSEIKSKFIHISTDCVFSGNSKKPYSEDDIKDGSDTYAITKALGEPFEVNSLTLRTSIVGPELKKNGSGLFHWFMNQSDRVNGFTKIFWSGVTTLELAKAILWFINQNYNGIYHITNNEVISKNELLNLFKIYTKKQIEIIPIEGIEINKSIVDTRRLIDYKIPSYDSMVSEMIQEMTRNADNYRHYKLN